MMDNSPHRWRPAILLVGVITGAFVASAFLAVVITQAITGADSGIAGFIMEKGPHKLMRRIMLLLALPFIPMLLRSAQWQGWMDTGQTAHPQRRIDPAWRRDLALGVAIGIASLGVMAVLSVFAGTRAWAPRLSVDSVLVLAGAAATALLIGWFEETLVRGILFRSLERLWSLVPAVLVSSLLFSVLHFIKASPSAFGEGAVLEQTLSVMVSALSYPFRAWSFLPRILNLTLMGVVLCLFVYRTRTIWIAAGTHAAWVWMEELNGLMTRSVDDGGGLWFGTRADATDSLATVVMFVILAILGLRFLPSRRAEEDP